MTKKYTLKSKNLLDVPMDDLGKNSESYVDLIEEREKITDEIGKLEPILADAFKASGRTKIFLRGRTLRLKEIEAKIKIQVQKKSE